MGNGSGLGLNEQEGNQQDDTKDITTRLMLAFFGSTCHMLSEFIREVAVLAVVFIPLDLWKHNEVTVDRVLLLSVLDVVVLCSGMFLQYVSQLCGRVRRHMEMEA